MMKLSKREKALLYLLILVALVAGMVMLVISPAMDRAEELDQRTIDAQATLEQMETTIGQMGVYRAGIRDARTQIAAESELYLPGMTDSELDRYVTTLVQRHGLRSEELAINAVDDTKNTGQAAAALAQAQALYAGETGESAPAASGMPTSSTSNVRVDVLVTGTLRQFVSLAQTVKDTDGIRISDMQLKRESSREEAVVSEAFTMNIGFSVLEYTDTLGLEDMTDSIMEN